VDEELIERLRAVVLVGERLKSLQRMFRVVVTDLYGVVYLLLKIGIGLGCCENSGIEENGNKNVSHKWILVTAKIRYWNSFEERVYHL
jgi:hypothetical protein